MTGTRLPCEGPTRPVGPLRQRACRRAALTALLLAAAASAGCRQGGLPAERAARLTGGSPAHGAQLIRGFGCGSCHTIPGIPGAQGQVGPPLAGLVGRAYIGGVLTNTVPHLVRWLMDPRAVDSLTAMPALGLTEVEARDISAYLYTR